MPNISMATARLADPAAMAQFLSPIPNSDQLAKVLDERKIVSSRAYDDETWTARFVASDGDVVKCFTVTGITIDQAEMIAAVCIDISAWQETEFREVVQRVLAPIPDPPRSRIAWPGAAPFATIPRRSDSEFFAARSRAARA